MGSLYLNDVIRTAKAEVGYQGAKKSSKYTRELDAVNYWNMGPKEGAADWCSIFFNWCVYKSTRNANEVIEPSKGDAHFFLFEPDSGENLAAGCTFAAQYYQRAGRWSDKCKDACTGDQVFFRNYAHTGLMIGYDNDGIYTIEGNVDGNKVEERFYTYAQAEDPSFIDGFGHPYYDGDEYVGATPEPEPTPDPEPTPEPTPEPNRYKVTTNGGILRLRSAPNTSSAYLIGIPNGTELVVSDIVEGEMIDYVTEWARTCYAGYNGYVSARWITKI